MIFVCSSYSETAEAEHFSFIAEIKAPYVRCQMLPQICGITIALHLSIANHASLFVLGSCQQYLRHKH